MKSCLIVKSSAIGILTLNSRLYGLTKVWLRLQNESCVSRVHNCRGYLLAAKAKCKRNVSTMATDKTRQIPKSNTAR